MYTGHYRRVMKLLCLSRKVRAPVFNEGPGKEEPWIEHQCLVKDLERNTPS